MTEPERTDRSIAEWASANPLPAVAVVIGALMVLGLLLGRLGDDEPSFEIPAATSVPQASDTATTVSTSPETFDPDRPEVDQLTCERLITGDEADAALFDDTSGPRGMFTFSRGETCRHEPSDESGNYVQIEPGDPTDFDVGATLLGVTGEPVGGVGDAAFWFDDGAIGILSVGVDIEIGSLIYRVHVGRSDLEEPGRLQRATELASLALPRFPFVVVEEPEPEVVIFDDQRADLPPFSLDDVLFDGVDSGGWTVGEGIISQLDGLIDGSLRESIGELPDRSASGVILAAQSYVAAGAADADEVQALLDRLLPSREKIVSRVIEPESLAQVLTVSLVELAQEDTEGVETCVPSEDEPCYLEFGVEEMEGLEPGKYEVYVAQPSTWTAEDVGVVQSVLVDAAVVFESISSMPPTRVVLGSGDDLHAGYVRDLGDCHAEIGDFLSGTDPDRLQQIIARELAFCSIALELYPQLFENPNPIRWLVYGLANYLSGVVYPDINLEHENLPGQLASEELSTTMPERSWTNWIFFEHLHPFVGGGAGVMDLLAGFSEPADLIAELSAAPGIAEIYHDLGRALSDANVSDLGPGTVPFEPQAWDLPVSGPTEVPVTVPQFGIRRIHLLVASGEYACVDSFSQGAVRMSWRAGAPGEPGSWSEDLPGSFEGDNVIVLTSVEPGGNYTLDVTDVSDDPDCDEEDEGTGGGGSDPVEDLCSELCDPSTYYWGPLRFGI